MLVTPETHRIEIEAHIAPPMQLAVTIPLAIDGRHSLFDGYTLYVALGGFHSERRESRRVLKAIAKAIGEHLKTLPSVEV